MNRECTAECVGHLGEDEVEALKERRGQVEFVSRCLPLLIEHRKSHALRNIARKGY